MFSFEAMVCRMFERKTSVICSVILTRCSTFSMQANRMAKQEMENIWVCSQTDCTHRNYHSGKKHSQITELE